MLTVQPATAQGLSVLRDAETEALLQDMVDPLAEAAGLGEGAVDIVILNDPSINAFVAGGQRIFIHSGLIDAADSANEVQGVLAHELGHITGGHVNRFSEGAGNATKITLISALLAAAAAAAGGGEAAMGILGAGQRAAMGSFLAFTRVQESSADAAGQQYLSEAGISGKGSLDFFRKLQSLEYRSGRKMDRETEFFRTHPLSSNRISNLEAGYVADPAWSKPSDPEIERRFRNAKAKLSGYLEAPMRTLQDFPVSMTGESARYARAYAYHKAGMLPEALGEAETLIAGDPDNPYFLELKGQILLESGKIADSVGPLRQATHLTNANPLIASTLGHALIESEDPALLEEAERVLRAAVGRDRQNPFAWYQLGKVYGLRGDIPRARLASAEQQIMSGMAREALFSAEAAEAALPTGTPDWLRAQDIALQARAQLEEQRDRR